MIQNVLRRAQDRNELPGNADLGRIIDLLSGALYYRLLVSREPVEADLPAWIVDCHPERRPPARGPSVERRV